jgi:F-type H+-transporting ATPase subunit alpha
VGGNAQIKAMKKIAGTLKLDQAQFRELEAFSKFGSDLDASTLTVLEKGIRNVEILKQPQYSPISVENQIALLYCGTKGLLMNIPVDKIKLFEEDYLNLLETKHKDVLASLRKGLVDDNIVKTLEDVAGEISKNYEK